MQSNELNDIPVTRELLEYYKSRLFLAEQATYDDLFGRLQEIQHGLSRMHSLERSLQEAIEEIESMNEKNIELADILKEVVGENIALRLKKNGYDTFNCHKIMSEYPKHKQYYETIISLLKNKIEGKKKPLNDGKRMNELITKCEKLERVVSEGVHEILRERKVRENCEIQLKEAMLKLEFQEKELKQRIDEINYNSKVRLDQDTNEKFLLQQQNEELKHKLIECQNKIDNIKKHSYDTIQEFEKQIKELKKRHFTTRYYKITNIVRRSTKINSELFLEIAFLCTKIKSIERIALKFAPLEGHRVNELFSDIEFVKKRAHHIENALFERKKNIIIFKNMDIIHKSLVGTSLQSKSNISTSISLFKENKKSSLSSIEKVSLSLVSVPSGSSTTSPTSLDIHKPSSTLLYPAGAVGVLCDINKSGTAKRFFSIPPNSTLDGGIVLSNSFLSCRSSITRDNIDMIAYHDSSGNSSRLLYDKYYGCSMRDELESQTKVKERVKALSCTTISPDGKYIAVGECGKSPRILLYSTASEESCLPIAISGHTFGIKCLSFSFDSKYLASVGFLHDATINIWLINDKSNCIRRLSNNKVTSLVRDISWMGMIVVTCGLRHVKLWKWNEEDANKTSNIGKTSVLEGKNIILGTMSDADFMSIKSFGKESVILCSSKGEICIVFEGERSIKRVFNTGYEISCIDINDLDNLLWVAGKHSQIEAYNITELLNKDNFNEGFKKEIVKSFKPMTQSPVILAIACDYSGHLVTVDGACSICIIDINDESKNQIIGGNSAKLMGVKNLRKNSLNAILMTWSLNGTVSFWDENMSCISTVNILIEQPENISDETIRNELKFVEYNYTSEEIIAGDAYGMLKTINLQSQKELWRQMAHDGEITCIDCGILDQKSIMISSGRDRMIQVWYQDTCNQDWVLEQTLDDHNSCINKACFHKKCRMLISCSADRTVVIRQLHEEAQNCRLRYLSVKVISLRSSALDFAFISEDSSRFFVSTLDRQLMQCDIQGQIIGSYKTSEELRETVFLDRIVISDPIVSNLDNTKKTALEQRFIAGLGNDKAIRIYDLFSCSFVAKNYIHTDGLTGITWIRCNQSNNKLKLVSTGLDVFAVWELSINEVQKLTTTHGISVNLGSPIRKVIPKSVTGHFPSGLKDVSIHSRKLWKTSASGLSICSMKNDDSLNSRRKARIGRNIVDQIEDSKRRSSSPVRVSDKKSEVCFPRRLSDNNTGFVNSTYVSNEKYETIKDNCGFVSSTHISSERYEIKDNSKEIHDNETQNDESILIDEINLLIDKLKQIHCNIKTIKKKDTQKRSMLFYTLENQLILMLNDLREQVPSVEIQNSRDLLEKYSAELIALVRDKISDKIVSSC
ncbi:hypothetical protein PMAC_000524 [Pneumocystis sp. 'macacae']|nr:hypothetical protein PMAC_000524 [Pneumocystis sp. 'macacae']